MVTIGSIWGGTFRFVRGNLRSALVWGCIIVLMSLVSTLVMGPFYQARLEGMQTGAPSAPNFGAVLIPTVVGIVVFTILWAAVFRAALFPEQSRFAYMRAGMDELRLLGTLLALFVGGYLVSIIVGAIVIGIAYAIGGGIVAAVLGLICFCAIIWAAIRISPAGPMTILQRKVVIGPAWRITRGAFWRLFGAYALLAIVFIIVYGLVFALQFGAILNDMLRPADPEAAARVALWQADHYAHFSIWSLIVAVVTGLLGGFALAFHAGMTAVATEQLLGRRGEKRLNEIFE
jgi:hypothetical protein